MFRSIKFPKLLYSYLATEMLAPFFASFLIMNSVFFLVKLIPFLNVVLELKIGFSDFVRLFLYLFPNMFLYSMPMAAMMGVIIGFTRLASDTEILAFKASGISLYQIIPPVILVSVAVALLTGYFSVTLIPKAEIAMKQLMFQLAKEKINKGIKEHQFTEALGDLVVFVDSIDPDTGEWQNVWVSDMRGQVNPIITMAQSGTMNAEIDNMLVSITLKNGSLHRPDERRSQIISFAHYTINIPLQPPTILDGEDVTQLSTGSMTLSQLQETATIVGRDTPRGRECLFQYHKRLVLPFGCFILSLLGLPLGLQAGPGKKGGGIPLGLGFFILYYIFFTLAKISAEENASSVLIAMWIPNSIFLIITAYLIRQAANERPIIPEKIKNNLLSIYDKSVSPYLQKVKDVFIKEVKKIRPDPLLTKPSPVVQDLSRSQLGPHYLSEGTIHGNVKSHVFHLPGCEFYFCKQCTIEFKNVEVAEQSGFEACRFCKPLLEEEKDRGE
ncbi:MAG: LptF/LptG family permease [Proteobacteria bacterium]|nr:LptF/LptG family permease [Pseudomonadota bacterium]MBU1059346.1 LptF/LptG family permease [Pseudomonadota bacterium]